jgi:hypothetical protein
MFALENKAIPHGLRGGRRAQAALADAVVTINLILVT